MLTSLILFDCVKLEKLPKFVTMESLKSFDLLRCTGYMIAQNYPEVNGDMYRLKELSLNSTGVRELPSSIGNLSGLRYLYLEVCEDLKLDARETAISQLPPSITKLGKLWTLDISPGLQQTSVFCQSSVLSYVNAVDLSNRNILSGLPEDLGSLQSLRYLHVSGSNISCLPESIKELLHLEYLIASTNHLKRCGMLLVIKEGKNPNDYYLFEVFEVYAKELCYGIRLEYENTDRKWRRKQRATTSPKLFPVPRKDTAVTTESGCSMVLEPSPTSSQASAKPDIAVQKEQNVELIRECGSSSSKMDDASKKRKRKISGTDENSLHDFDGS
ncbi:hypothetical protein FXO38_21842 [Capsicum annuum]|nr:hypothetical protein FXO38_21842 [Capsicum annuum]